MARGQQIRTAMMALAGMALLLAQPARAQFGGLGGLAKDVLRGVESAKKVGDALHEINEQEEIQLGGDLAALLLGAGPLVDDAETQRYVNRIGRWLAMHSERPNLPWKFGVIESDDFNAFSTPGGYVLVSRGLLEQMRSESELAGVLAHEVAHVVRKHHLAALKQGLQNEALGSMNDYFGGTRSLGGGEFTELVLSAGKTMYLRGLDKNDEYEADRMAVVIAARSGYSPYGLGGVLQTLSSATGKDDGFSLTFKTHPSPVDRIERLDRAMGARLDTVAVVEDLPGFARLRMGGAKPGAR